MFRIVPHSPTLLSLGGFFLKEGRPLEVSFACFDHPALAAHCRDHNWANRVLTYIASIMCLLTDCENKIGPMMCVLLRQNHVKNRIMCLPLRQNHFHNRIMCLPSRQYHVYRPMMSSPWLENHVHADSSYAAAKPFLTEQHFAAPTTFSRGFFIAAI